MDEVALPVEFVVRGVPKSSQAAATSLIKWKQRIAGVARGMLPADYFCFTLPVAVTIYYFSDESSTVDIDNIVRPILDSLGGIIYIDDKQVERVLVQRVPAESLLAVKRPSACLAGAMDEERPLVFVRVHDDLTPLEQW